MNPHTSFPDIIEVWWDDAETCGDGSWMDAESVHEALSTPLPVVKSVGFLCHSDDSFIAITDNVVATGSTGNITKIPKGMIRNIYYLQRKD